MLTLSAQAVLIIMLGKGIKYTLLADLLPICMLLTTRRYFPMAMLCLMEVSKLLLLEEKESAVQALEMFRHVRLTINSSHQVVYDFASLFSSQMTQQTQDICEL